MDQQYQISGLHCDGCVKTVTNTLESRDEIQSATVSLADNTASVQAELPLDLNTLNEILKTKGNYQLSKVSEPVPTSDATFWWDKTKWKRASFNTLNCLIGCSIGDFGMVFYLQAFHPETPMVWQMVLAIIAGLCTSIILETILLKSRENFNWKQAFNTAIGMSFISMVAMELAMTSTDFMITGGKAAFDDPVYWLALLPALIVGFITPLPYNYYKLKKFDKACH